MLSNIYSIRTSLPVGLLKSYESNDLLIVIIILLDLNKDLLKYPLFKLGVLQKKDRPL